MFEAQLKIAAERGMPALVHTPHRDKLGGTLASVEVVKRVGIDAGMVLLDHLNEVTMSWHWKEVAGPVFRSTRTPRWTRTGWSR
ncbi:hypothetical protein [Mycobacterium tilburgii]|uniref:hypothetical protein n=1 Tax=Mycobacterium tilburgii TaxID=44467 RepID=UPI0021B2422B|nr:hypothetical protein [Mycobacterium tilburgii]